MPTRYASILLHPAVSGGRQRKLFASVGNKKLNYFRPAIYHYQAQANPFFWRRKLPRMDVGAALSDLVSYPKCVFTGQIITQTLTSYSQWDREKEARGTHHLCYFKETVHLKIKILSPFILV